MHGEVHVGLLIIFGVVMLPVYAMILGWLVGKPREYKPVGIAFGYIVVYIALTIIGLGVVGTVIGLLA